MERIVLTFKESVMQANEKTSVDKNKLIEVAKKYGVVEDFDTVTNSMFTEYQNEINNLVAQLTALKDHKLTAGELVLLRKIREVMAAEVAKGEAEKQQLRTELASVKTNNEAQIAKISALLDNMKEQVSIGR